MTASLKAITIIYLSTLGNAFAFAPTATSSRLNIVDTKLFVNSDIGSSNESSVITSRRSALTSFLTAASASLITTAASPPHATAAESRTLGRISGSGLVFKDTLVVESFDDPKVKGVTLYVSNFERPMTERIQKDFFTEPSYASVTAVKTGSIEIADNIDKSDKGEPVFEEKRSLLFKEIRVQRIYDVEKNTLVYVSFNTRLDKSSDTNNSRFKSSVVAIPLN